MRFRLNFQIFLIRKVVRVICEPCSTVLKRERSYWSHSTTRFSPSLHKVHLSQLRQFGQEHWQFRLALCKQDLSCELILRLSSNSKVAKFFLRETMIVSIHGEYPLAFRAFV